VAVGEEGEPLEPGEEKDEEEKAAEAE